MLPSRTPKAPRTGEQGGVLLVLLVLMAGGVAAWQFGLFDSILAKEEVVAVEGAPVRRGPLRISEVVRGNLEAKDSISLRSEIQGRSTIIFLEEEGTQLEEGQLVCELDVSELEDNLVRQEIEVKNAEADFTKAREQYDIQVIQNESDIAAAELALELAQLDLDKYQGDSEGTLPTATSLAQATGDDTVQLAAGEVDDSTEALYAAAGADGAERGNGEWANEIASVEETVTLREEDLARAEKDLEWSERLWQDGFVQQNEYEADVLATKRAEIQLQQALRERDLLLRYGKRRKLAELRADVATRNRDIEKTRKQASARLADYEAARESSRYKLDRERQQLDELRQQVGKSKIYAPEGGLLVYARERGRWGSGDVIEEGDEVRERQEIGLIPRAGGMTVQASIHETKLKKVEVGQPCQVTIDAFPDRLFDGEVAFVAVMAESGGWRSNPNQRMYKADIALLETTPEMRPGMSASVEILIEDLEDVHYIPRQCVFLDGDETIVFVMKGGQAERRTVEVGLDNNKWVCILEGLSDGETVALSPPADFEPRAATPEDGFGEIGSNDGEGGGAKASTGDRAAAGSGGDRSSGGRPGGGSRPSRGAEGQRGGAGGGAGNGGGGGNAAGGVDREAMRKAFESMSAEEKKAAMERFRKMRESGGGSGSGRGGRSDG